jgi:predicted nucleic acid-binding protein
MSLIYWDTMLFVYWLEEHPDFAPRVRTILSRMEEREDVLCTSSFALAELLVAPYKTGNAALAEKIRSALQPPFVRVIPFSSDTAEHYARIRAKHGIAPADSIQLACAAEARVDLFLTNDRGLAGKMISGIQFVAGLEVNLF